MSISGVGSIRFNLEHLEQARVRREARIFLIMVTGLEWESGPQETQAHNRPPFLFGRAAMRPRCPVSRSPYLSDLPWRRLSIGSTRVMTKWTRSPPVRTALELRPFSSCRSTRAVQTKREKPLVPCCLYQRLPPWQPRRESCLHARMQEGLAVIHQSGPLGPSRLSRGTLRVVH